MRRFALDKNIVEYDFQPENEIAAFDVDYALSEIFDRFIGLLLENLKKQKALKFQLKIYFWMET